MLRQSNKTDSSKVTQFSVPTTSGAVIRRDALCKTSWLTTPGKSKHLRNGRRAELNFYRAHDDIVVYEGSKLSLDPKDPAILG